MKRAVWGCSQLSAAGHVTEPNLAKGQSETSLISRGITWPNVLFCQVTLFQRSFPPSALKIFFYFKLSICFLCQFFSPSIEKSTNQNTFVQDVSL